MKVRELKNFLELQAGEARAGQLLQRYSHWIAAIFQAGEYRVGNPKDLGTLRKLEGLGLVEIREKNGLATAALSREGKELYSDFYKHGYY